MSPSFRPRLARAIAWASVLALSSSPVLAADAEKASITVQLDQAGIAVPTTLHGLFFEDINYGADGGLYAELIQNRSFEHADATYAWAQATRGGAQGKYAIESEVPLNANNPHFLRVNVVQPGTAGVAAVNGGFEGIPVIAGDQYRFSVYARRRAGEKMALKISLEDGAGRVLAEGTVPVVGTAWKKHELVLKSSATVKDARLVVLATDAGTVDLEMVSLFPVKTFKGRPNGLRADLAQALADIKPGFLRFPGGCVVEGKDIGNMYRWKDTIGDVAERQQNWNLWQDRQSPQYSQTYGLGFFEFFQFCEDIGAAPLPVLNCGMSCQARQGVHVSVEELAPYVQDALDLIEFANGPVTSEWGAKRAAMGHPKPFDLKYLGVGNEQWNQEYFDRYDIFHKALKAKYPEIVLVTTAGPQPDDHLFRFAWDKFKSGTPAEIVDEHYYRPPQWFLEQNDRYDSYDRKGPKIFVGEYAAHEPNRRNTLRSAIMEASYGTALWRNADVVAMSSYAPLLAHINHTQWKPDLIWFDNTRVALTPNYHVQAMLSQNRPDIVVPVKVSAPMVQPIPIAGAVGVGTWLTQAEYKDIIVTRNGETLFSSDFSQGSIIGWEPRGGSWEIVDGALRQTSGDENCRIFVGDTSWTDYTLTVKARKLSGTEGFLISFGANEGGLMTWNIGGWGNTQHGLDVPGSREPYIPGRIETGRWYDIRVEVKGSTVKCFLDGKLVQDAVSKATPSVFASAGRSKKTGEIVVAVANPAGTARTVSINLAGIKGVKSAARAVVLTSTSPEDENSFEKPRQVAPRESSVELKGTSFEQMLPAWSFTVLRIKQ